MATPQEIQIFKKLIDKGLDAEKAKQVVIMGREKNTLQIMGENLGIKLEPTELQKDIKQEGIQLATPKEQSLFNAPVQQDDIREVGANIPQTREEIQAKQGVTGFISESKSSISDRIKKTKNIYKETAIEAPKNFKDIFTNIPKEVAYDFSRVLATMGNAVGGVFDVGYEAVENTIQKITPEQTEKAIQDTIQKAVNTKGVKFVLEKLGEFEKKHPIVASNIESTINLTALGRGGKAISKTGDIEKSKAIMKEAGQEVERFIRPTKETTKTITSKITPDIIKKGIVGTRESVEKLATEKIKEVGKQIDDFIKEGKVKGDMPIDNLVNTLADVDKTLRFEGKILPGKESQVKFIESQLNFLGDVQKKFGNKLPPEKQIVLKRAFDEVFDTKITRDKITKFQDDLQLKLADTLRAELAKNNPQLDVLNKEFSFYKGLETVMKETNRRTTGQAKTGLIETIGIGQQGTVGAVAGATVGGAIAGPTGATIGAILGGATGVKLKSITSNPKWSLVSAQKKAKLAEAIAKGDRRTVDNIIDSIIVTQLVPIKTNEE